MKIKTFNKTYSKIPNKCQHEWRIFGTRLCEEVWTPIRLAGQPYWKIILWHMGVSNGKMWGYIEDKKTEFKGVSIPAVKEPFAKLF